MQSKYIYFVFGVNLLISISVVGQEEKKILHDANKAYLAGKVMESTSLYKKSLKEKPTYYKANFNLGDALYKTGNLIKTGKMPPPNKRMTPDSAANIVFEQAAEQFEVVAKSVSNADTIQKAWHNFGNAKLMQKNFEEAVMGYKKSLKLNPKDEDTRYNLAYAQRLLKKQKNQDKEQKKKNEPKNQKEKDKEKINNPNDKNKNEAQQPEMSKEQAEKMLNALKNSEKNNQQLRDKKGEPGQSKSNEKDW